MQMELHHGLLSLGVDDTREQSGKPATLTHTVRERDDNGNRVARPGGATRPRDPRCSNVSRRRSV
jgi:hypothetical protein